MSDKDLRILLIRNMLTDTTRLANEAYDSNNHELKEHYKGQVRGMIAVIKFYEVDHEINFDFYLKMLPN